MPKTEGGHGRDPAITVEKTERILQAIRTGSRLESAAEYAGVPRPTFFRWLQIGRREGAEEVYRVFAEEVEQALAQFEVAAMARITKAGEEFWQADAWRLERRFPDGYGRRTRVDGNLTVQAVPFVDLDKLTVEEATTLRNLLQKAAPNVDQIPAGGRAAGELLPGEEVIEGELVGEAA